MEEEVLETAECFSRLTVRDSIELMPRRLLRPVSEPGGNCLCLSLLPGGSKLIESVTHGGDIGAKTADESVHTAGVDTDPTLSCLDTHPITRTTLVETFDSDRLTDRL